MFFGKRVSNFYSSLSIDELPPEVKVMNPYQDKKTLGYAEKFLDKYFSDNKKRLLIFGINAGRFGAGLTGVNFSDPVVLREILKIENDLKDKRELSSIFIYKVIEKFGGPEKFYKNFFLTALSPLGFTKDGKNYNYYDDKNLLERTLPFIVESVKKQIKIGGETKAAIILGTGKNYKIFSELNKKHKFFKNIYPLEHPRFIMQYRRKTVDDYVKKYLLTLSLVTSEKA